MLGNILGFNVQVDGYGSAVVGGVKDVLAFEQDVIKVAVLGGQIVLEGVNLQLDYYNDYEIKVSGKITCLNLIENKKKLKQKKGARHDESSV